MSRDAGLEWFCISLERLGFSGVGGCVKIEGKLVADVLRPAAVLARIAKAQPTTEADGEEWEEAYFNLEEAVDKLSKMINMKA